MNMIRCLLWVVAFLLVSNRIPAADSETKSELPKDTVQSLQFLNPPGLQLLGQDARIQLVVEQVTAGGSGMDVTRSLTYSTEPDGIVEIDPSGYVVPVGNGSVNITATSASGLASTYELQVGELGNEEPISFPGRIVPIFTKLGCNGGGCHGKASGQNGFKLSLLGFEPREDYRHLLGETRGRRISPAFPDQSLLLQKAVNVSPHGGGQRLDIDSHEYRVLRRWVAQGMPYGPDPPPQVASIEVLPSHRRMSADTSQQLTVIATYDDGSFEDVTRAAVFESNDPEMGEVNSEGLVQVGSAVGDVAIMVRYQGKVTVFRADLPLPAGSVQLAAGETLTPEPANLVDEHVFNKLRSLGIPAAAPSDDATFLRRVTLDIAGRLPTVQEAREFAADASPEKRAALVDRLLASRDYAEYFASKWNTILRNRRSRGELHYATVAFHNWILQSLYENKPYDDFVRELIAASGSVASNPAVTWYQQVPDLNQRVEDAAQLFLGQRIQCARCHHHPYEKWSQADYAQMAAFFTTVRKRVEADPVEPTFFTAAGQPRSPNPRTGQALAPAGLDGETINVDAGEDPRVELADWMTDPSNPFFAKALVNRYWKHFFARGLVEPEDDLRITNPPSNPELLDALAGYFVDSGYDLKALIRVMTLSRTYGLSSEPRQVNLADKKCYSRFYPKRMTAEVLLDAVDRVTAAKTHFAGMPTEMRAVALPDTAFNSYFLKVFGQPDSTTACECERAQDANLAQSLHLLNSEEVQGKLASPAGRATQLLADQDRTIAAKISELYELSLSRLPSDKELQIAVRYIESKENSQAAYEDIIWSLINSKEFLFNH